MHRLEKKKAPKPVIYASTFENLKSKSKLNPASAKEKK